MIRLDSLSCGFKGSTVLHNLDLQVSKGEFVGLLGPNGAGKTTLLSTLSGLLEPHSGSIHLAGEDAATLSPRQRARLVGTVPQKLEIPAGLTGQELVLMGRYCHTGFWQDYSAEDHATVEQVMRQTGTNQFADRPAQALSGGELQRLAIARALAQQTSILLLDEATSSLDVARKLDVFALFSRLHSQDRTILAAIHDVNLAALHCRRLVFLKDGKIVADGPTTEIFTAEILEMVYETRPHIIRHPATGAPQALFQPHSGDAGGVAADAEVR